MNKFFLSIFLLLGCCICAKEDKKKEQTEELYTFTSHIFHMLREGEEVVNQRALAQLESYTKEESHPAIAHLAAQFSDLLKEKGKSKEEALGEAVSALGRHIKRSVDSSSYQIERGELQRERERMEQALGERCPKVSSNEECHKLMMDSLVSGAYDVALYAYLRMAEERCSS